jgi:hypothetical protein
MPGWPALSWHGSPCAHRPLSSLAPTRWVPLSALYPLSGSILFGPALHGFSTIPGFTPTLWPLQPFRIIMPGVVGPAFGIFLPGAASSFLLSGSSSLYGSCSIDREKGKGVIAALAASTDDDRRPGCTSSSVWLVVLSALNLHHQLCALQTLFCLGSLLP